MKKSKSFCFEFYEDFEKVPKEFSKIDINEILGCDNFDISDYYEEWMAEIEEDYYSSNELL